MTMYFRTFKHLLPHAKAFDITQGTRGRPFVLEIKTDNPGSSASNQFTLRLNDENDFDYAFVIYWGDGVREVITAIDDPKLTHTYPSAGSYVIQIQGRFPAIQCRNTGDKLKITKLIQYGDIEWRTFWRAFQGCANMHTSNVDTPNLYFCGELFAMFQGCVLATPNVSKWNTANIVFINDMFRDMNFNPDVSQWYTGNLTHISFFTADNSLANPDVTNWDTENVEVIDGFAENNNAFDRDLSGWKLPKLRNALNFMTSSSGLSTPNYDSTLISWGKQAKERTIATGQTVNFGGSKYTTGGAAEEGRQNLVSIAGWTILDGGAA